MSRKVEDVFLEDVEGDKAIEFVSSANKMCLKGLGDPLKSESGSYSKILKVLESDERIPFVSKMGTDESGEALLYNLWKDNKNRRGLWRRTTLSSYESNEPNWTTVLDLDELARKENQPWVWRGSRVLPRSRDPMSSDAKMVTRALISLSRGDSDEIEIREFDLLSSDFVSADAFNLPPGKTNASYKSRDILLVSSDSGPDSLTKAGYPRTVREWTRGTDISQAKVVFEGEISDLTVSAYISDQRLRGGGITEVRTRALTFNTSKHWARKLKPEHLLSEDDPQRKAAGEPSEFKPLELPGDSEIDFVGNLLIIWLRSDWSPEKGKQYTQGSIVYVNAHKFIKYGPTDRIYHVLFNPSERVSCDNYCATKGYIILSIMENMKSKFEFYRLERDGNKVRLIGMDKNPQIRAINVRAVDPYDGDEFWLTTNSYTEPNTLYLADASKMDSEDKKVVRKTGSEGYIVRKLKALPEQFDASNLEVTQNLARSRDGTKIPYFMIMKKGTELDRLNPTLLYAFGGFQVTLGPHYLGATGLAWLERGGVYVEAIVRGGGEFGPSWHQGGIREKRHKSQEDFIAVAEELIESKVCKAKTLAIRGGSNGGLLVANSYIARPDLFGAVHCAVPILDLKRYKAMAAADHWVEEFGDPDSDDWDIFLKDYSPYHSLNESQKKYPPILFTTSTWEQSVHPGHARKMVKKLWDKGAGKKWPTYFYEYMKPSSSVADDARQHAFLTALSYDFLYKTLQKNLAKKK